MAWTGRRDLRGLEPAEQAQGQRRPGIGSQRRVAAQQHQPQLVVGDDVDDGVETAPLRIVVSPVTAPAS